MQNYDTILTDTIELFFLSHCVTPFFHFYGMPIHPNTVSSGDPFSTVLHGKASVFQGPFFYGISCMYCMTCVSYMFRIARQTTFFLFPILIIPVLDMESPQRDPRPPTLPTTIQACPDSTHEEPDYHLPIWRMDTLLISPQNCSFCVILSSPDITHTCWS